MLTVNGNAELVVQDAEGYQHLLELKERRDTFDVLGRRLATVGNKQGRSAEEFFKAFFREHKYRTGQEIKTFAIPSIRRRKLIL